MSIHSRPPIINEESNPNQAQNLAEVFAVSKKDMAVGNSNKKLSMSKHSQKGEQNFVKKLRQQLSSIFWHTTDNKKPTSYQTNIQKETLAQLSSNKAKKAFVKITTAPHVLTAEQSINQPEKQGSDFFDTLTKINQSRLDSQLQPSFFNYQDQINNFDRSGLSAVSDSNFEIDQNMFSLHTLDANFNQQNNNQPEVKNESSMENNYHSTYNTPSNANVDLALKSDNKPKPTKIEISTLGVQSHSLPIGVKNNMPVEITNLTSNNKVADEKNLENNQSLTLIKAQAYQPLDLEPKNQLLVINKPEISNSKITNKNSNNQPRILLRNTSSIANKQEKQKRSFIDKGRSLNQNFTPSVQTQGGKVAINKIVEHSKQDIISTCIYRLEKLVELQEKIHLRTTENKIESLQAQLLNLDKQSSADQNNKLQIQKQIHSLQTSLARDLSEVERNQNFLIQKANFYLNFVGQSMDEQELIITRDKARFEKEVWGKMSRAGFNKLELIDQSGCGKISVYQKNLFVKQELATNIDIQNNGVTTDTENQKPNQGTENELNNSKIFHLDSITDKNANAVLSNKILQDQKLSIEANKENSKNKVKISVSDQNPNQNPNQNNDQAQNPAPSPSIEQIDVKITTNQESTAIKKTDLENSVETKIGKLQDLMHRQAMMKVLSYTKFQLRKPTNQAELEALQKFINQYLLAAIVEGSADEKIQITIPFEGRLHEAFVPSKLKNKTAADLALAFCRRLNEYLDVIMIPESNGQTEIFRLIKNTPDEVISTSPIASVSMAARL